MRKLLSYGILFFVSVHLHAQASFTLSGDAFSSGGNCYVLTPDSAWQTGTAWCNTPINLSQPLSIQYNIYFGSQDLGADGIAFVLQNQGPGVTGSWGQGLGYQGLTPSVVIEFDTFQNGFDPLDDHAGLTLNGEPDHTMAVNAGNPVYSFPVNIEDGNWHSIEIDWDPATFTLQLIFDCQPVLSYTNDITNNIFSGNPSVWWGFTSATGGAMNLQQFCYAPPLVLNTNHQDISCNGQCNGSAAVSNVSGGTGPYSYLWNNGQTTTSIGALCPGSYSVTVTSALGCTTIDTMTITQPAVLTCSMSSTPVSCSGSGSATANVSGGTGPFTYLWNPSGAVNATVTGLSAGNYSVTVTDANGCAIANSVLVAATGSISATVNANSTICSGQSVTLTASGGTNYAWSNGVNVASQVVSPLTPTSYSVVVSTGTCKDTAYVTVSVNTTPTVSITGNNVICKGDMTTLAASGGSNYAWSNGSSSASIIVSPSSAATYSVISVNGNCSSTAQVTVTVSNPPIAGATSATICAGQTATLLGFGGSTYAWSNGASGNVISVSPSSNTTYTVIVSIGSCKDTAQGNVIVKPVPVAGTSGNVTITAGNTTTIGATGGGTYSWNYGGSGAVVTVAPPTTTTLCVTVNQNGCTDTACLIVFVEPLDCGHNGTLYLPNAFSPNSDGQNDLLRSYYGNPKCIKTFELHIFNRWGEQVFNTDDPLFTWNGTFNGKEITDAVFMYILKAELLTGEKIERKGNISLIH